MGWRLRMRSITSSMAHEEEPQINADERRSDLKRGVAMVLTPAGVGGIAVVRLRGEGVDQFLEKHFSKQVQEGKCVHGEIRDGEVAIDDAVVVRGENFVDLNLHGGIWVVKAVMELAKRLGFCETDDVMEMVDG